MTGVTRPEVRILFSAPEMTQVERLFNLGHFALIGKYIMPWGQSVVVVNIFKREEVGIEKFGKRDIKSSANIEDRGKVAGFSVAEHNMRKRRGRDGRFIGKSIR